MNDKQWSEEELLMSAFLDEELTREERLRLEAWLRDNPQRAAEFRRMQRVDKALEGAPVAAVSDREWEQQWNKIAAGSLAAPRLFKQASSGRFKAFTVFVSAVAAVLMIVFGMQLYQLHAPSQRNGTDVSSAGASRADVQVLDLQFDPDTVVTVMQMPLGDEGYYISIVQDTH